MSNSKYSFLLPIVIFGSLGLGIIMGSTLGKSPEAPLQSKNHSNIEEIVSYIDKYYVDSVKSAKLMEESIQNMLHKLDPHSNYIPASEMKAVAEQMDGKFGGVGIRFAIIRDTLCVTNVIKNSPSAQVGILPGDKIISIDGKQMAGKKQSNESYMGKLKGVPNTRVKVSVLRHGKIVNKTIVRGEIPIPTVLCAQMLDEKLGYIRLDQFSRTSAIEFRAAGQSLLSKGMTKLIFDLRDNPGGLLPVAIEIADEFLPQGRKVVSVKGKSMRSEEYTATAVGNLENVELVILINENSASAAEILAGAIQDNDRGQIVGRRTFGKGLVQRDIILRDNSSLRLTIARYYMPSGRCIQKPYSDDFEEYIKDKESRQENNEYFVPNNELYKKGKAFKTLKGRTVYDASGVMPDVFVPLDTAASSRYFFELRFSPAFQHLAFDFANKHRASWKSVQIFNTQFSVGDDMLGKLTSYASKQLKVKYNDSEFKQSKELIRRALKAEIARQLFVEEGYFFILGITDKEVIKARELLK